MTMHISNQGPRRITVSFSADEPPATRIAAMACISDFLAKHEQPRGGRFIFAMADPVDFGHPAGATAVIDTLQDATEPPLFLDMHRALRKAAKKAGTTIASADPDA
jgi:hypothetical protein